MRKQITGTGGMLLIQTLKDAGVDYLFTNPGSAETGIFAALAEDGDQRLVVGKHEGLVAAMADGYHRLSGKVGVIIAHVMGGSYQVAANPAAITVATTRALREATTPPTGPVYLSISAELLNREGLEATIGEAANYQIERPGPARVATVEKIAKRL